MTDFLNYLVTLATSAWSMLLDPIGQADARMIAYIFILLCSFAAICFCFQLAARLFTFVFTLLRRGGGQ